MNIAQEREFIRSDILRQRKNLPLNERTSLSNRIATHIIEWIHVNEKNVVGCTIDVVMVYLNMKSEANTSQLIESLFNQNKQVIAPVVDTKSRQLIPRQIQDLENDLVHHKLGMLEPRDSCRYIPPEKLQLILVPGIAFDCSGYRLGYGKGFYDRFLPKCTNAVTIGIAYQLQIVKDTYPQPWDIPVQHIFTENGLL